MRVALAFAFGLLFGVGLILSGMTQPAKVIGFLDVFGNWDPSLAFVMIGALLIKTPLYRFSLRRRRPFLAELFRKPSATAIDLRLLAGAVLFGVGWAIGGYCPGPAITSLGSLESEAWVFGAAMFLGFFLEGWVLRRAVPKVSA